MSRNWAGEKRGDLHAQSAAAPLAGRHISHAGCSTGGRTSSPDIASPNPEAVSNFSVPMVARSTILCDPSPPIAFDFARMIFVRSGAATLHGEFGQRKVAQGDVVLLAANTACGNAPAGSISSTTLYLDCDYVIDQLFWQHSADLAGRTEALEIFDAIYADPAQVLHLGKDRVGYLSLWLDEIVSLSIAGPRTAHFFRMQSLLFALVHAIVPFIGMSSECATPSRQSASRAALLRRRLAPLRAEIRLAADRLRSDYERRWTLAELAREVHLSPSQLGRLFADSFGKSPIAYLTTIRVERMAALLRESDWPVYVVARQVGWHDPDYATRQFRRVIGMTPRLYRALSSRVTVGG
jgi:AraC family transcriptional regulator